MADSLRYEYAVLEHNSTAVVIRRSFEQAWGPLLTARWEHYTKADDAASAHQIANALNRQRKASE